MCNSFEGLALVPEDDCLGLAPRDASSAEGDFMVSFGTAFSTSKLRARGRSRGQSGVGGHTSRRAMVGAKD
eukprot:4688310-Heterocapsa_arctica.AAC.1